eukprot:TRINITY_DN332_c0_g2_i1.p2 TRINITY_DN332_c0_g2~~TRINITY_DN332_c0_g2_i1.p2  ORF type:complete len:148 (+),score=26.63 TRINITY_DN332_c0_g2_i1:22-444(+)
MHGRLFAQFLHHAFPRDCPYPHAHIVSSNSSARRDEWITLMDKSATPSKRVLDDYLKAASLEGNSTKKAHELPWTSEEELFMRSIWLDGNGIAANDGDAGMSVPGTGLLLVFVGVAIAFRAPIMKVVGVSPKPMDKGHYV